MSSWLLILAVCAIIAWLTRPQRTSGAGLSTYIRSLNQEAGDSPFAWVVGFVCLTCRFAPKGDPLAVFYASLIPAFLASALANALTNGGPGAPWDAVWLPSGVLVTLVYVRSGFRPAFSLGHIMILAVVSAVGAGLTDPDSWAAYSKATTVSDYLIAVCVGGTKWLFADTLKVAVAALLAARFKPAWLLSQTPTKQQIAKDLCQVFLHVALIVAPTSALVGICSRIVAEWSLGQFSPFSLSEHFGHWVWGDLNSQAMLGSLTYVLVWRLAAKAGAPRLSD